MKPTFSLIITFFILQKLKRELKILLQSLHTIALSKDTIFAKNCCFFAEKCWHQQN